MLSTQSILQKIYDALQPAYKDLPKKAIYEAITNKLNDLACENWTGKYISSVLKGSLTSVGEVFERTVMILWENMQGTSSIEANTEEVIVLAKPGAVHSGAIILTESRQCKNPACKVHFVPKQSTQKYCEPACRKHAWYLRKEVKNEH